MHTRMHTRTHPHTKKDREVFGRHEKPAALAVNQSIGEGHLLLPQLLATPCGPEGEGV